MKSAEEIERKRRIKRAADMRAVSELRRQDRARDAATLVRDRKVARSLEIADEMIARAEAEGLSPIAWLRRESCGR